LGIGHRPRRRALRPAPPRATDTPRRHCDTIIGPVASGYATTASLESLARTRVYNQRNLGVCPRRASDGWRHAGRASRFGLEECYRPIRSEEPHPAIG